MAGGSACAAVAAPSRVLGTGAGEGAAQRLPLLMATSRHRAEMGAPRGGAVRHKHGTLTRVPDDRNRIVPSKPLPSRSHKVPPVVWYGAGPCSDLHCPARSGRLSLPV